MPTELRRLLRLAIAAALLLTMVGPAFDAAAATDLYPGAPAIVNSISAPFASIKSTPDPAAVEIAQIDNGVPAEIVAGPSIGSDGLLWYQVTVAGFSGYIAEADLSWGITESTEPAPVTEQAPLVVTGNGVVISPDGTDIACRVAPREDADLLFTYASGSAVDLAGQPVDGWQPVICAAQLGYLPAILVFDPANLPAPAVEQTPDAPAVTELATEVIPEVTETIVITEETATPEMTETVAEATDTPAITETVSAATETPDPVETAIAVTSTPEIVETIAEEMAETSTSTPTETVTDLPSQTDATETVTSTPSQTESTQTPTPEVDITPAVTEIAEVIEATEIVGQTMLDADLAVMPAGLASAAAVYNTGGGGLRCRVAPSLEAQVLMVFSPGAAVTLTGYASNGWQPVVCNGQNGFAAARFLQPTDGGTIEEAPTTPGGSIASASIIVQNTGGAGLRCRSGADLTASIITVLPEGTTVPSRGIAANGWQPVTCAGSAGWVHTDFVGAAPGSGSSGGNVGGSTGAAIGSATVANTGGVGVRFRSSSSFDGAVIAVLMEGTSVTLRDGSSGSWTAVTYDGRNGFIFADYLATARNPSTPGAGSGVGSTTLAAGSNAKVTDSLNFRSGPSYSAGVVGIASAGTVVRVTGAASSGFYPVKWAESTGYMYGDYLVYTTEALSTTGPNGGVGGNTGGGGAGNAPGSGIGQAMVDYAMRYLGYPYIWATHGPNSFDCSGFTYWVVLNVTGQNIGAGTWTQWETGAPVQYGSLQQGDLVFFQNTYTIGLSHVGMYIGNDQFIHAENENTGVRISSLTSTYYATRYLGARRMA